MDRTLADIKAISADTTRMSDGLGDFIDEMKQSMKTN